MPEGRLGIAPQLINTDMCEQTLNTKIQNVMNKFIEKHLNPLVEDLSDPVL
jgi:hypothetical protein